MRCPCCDGTGTVSADAEPPVYLSKRQRRIWGIVRRFPGLQAQDLANMVYADDLDGGPLGATETVRVHIRDINRRLAVVRQCISGQRNGHNGYRLYQD